MRSYAMRLEPGADLKTGIEKFVQQNGFAAGCVLAAVGSLEKAVLRFAAHAEGTQLEGPLEIQLVNGTLAPAGCHLHIAVADSAGTMRGGHLLDGCIVRTTAEIVIGVPDQLAFEREYDERTGFRELRVRAVLPWSDEEE